tara:strand:+ start:12696 stop:13139 length:444 start_codon:yes stop_codon:yes gene_type:complete
MNLDDVLSEWKIDSEINEMALDEASRDSAKLHSKYLEMFMSSKLHAKRKEQQLQTLLKQKWLYYNGKMTQSEIESEGWEFDPFNGMKVLKGDLTYYYDADKDIQKIIMQIEYRKALRDTLKEIMENIKWRHQNIGNIIKWRQFVSGV